MKIIFDFAENIIEVHDFRPDVKEHERKLNKKIQEFKSKCTGDNFSTSRLRIIDKYFDFDEDCILLSKILKD